MLKVSALVSLVGQVGDEPEHSETTGPAVSVDSVAAALVGGELKQ